MRAISFSRLLIVEQWQEHAIPSGQRLAVFLGSKHGVEVVTRHHADE